MKTKDKKTKITIEAKPRKLNFTISEVVKEKKVKKRDK